MQSCRILQSSKGVRCISPVPTLRNRGFLEKTPLRILPNFEFGGEPWKTLSFLLETHLHERLLFYIGGIFYPETLETLV